MRRNASIPEAAEKAFAGHGPALLGTSVVDLQPWSRAMPCLLSLIPACRARNPRNSSWRLQECERGTQKCVRYEGH
jgi:hypothetical protein